MRSPASYPHVSFNTPKPAGLNGIGKAACTVLVTLAVALSLSAFGAGLGCAGALARWVA